MDAPIHLLRTIARRFAQIQRRTWACCTPATETQCLILTELYQAPGLSIRELAARIGSDSPWVSRVVEGLRSQGWIERHPDPIDRRQVRVRLTVAGQDQANQLQWALNRQAEDLLSQLPPEKRLATMEALSWLADILDTTDAECGDRPELDCMTLTPKDGAPFLEGPMEAGRE